MEAFILGESERHWHDRGGGVRTAYLVRRELGDVGFLSGMTEFDPGARLPFHFHNCDESVVVLDGEALFETADGATVIGKHAATWIGAGLVHRFANPNAEPLTILWIYGSPDATRALAESGSTEAISAEGTVGR